MRKDVEAGSARTDDQDRVLLRRQNARRVFGDARRNLRRAEVARALAADEFVQPQIKDRRRQRTLAHRWKFAVQPATRGLAGVEHECARVLGDVEIRVGQLPHCFEFDHAIKSAAKLDLHRERPRTTRNIARAKVNDLHLDIRGECADGTSENSQRARDE